MKAQKLIHEPALLSSKKLFVRETRNALVAHESNHIQLLPQALDAFVVQLLPLNCSLAARSVAATTGGKALTAAAEEILAVSEGILLSIGEDIVQHVGHAFASDMHRMCSCPKAVGPWVGVPQQLLVCADTYMLVHTV